ncbi:MAG TPA: tetratricopeptide repeat protein [Thermoanaerobaculia bacterium]|jgi:tetratricopeptide (TPR) repeat protein|nr:tetratricopeptide repeat protein [Thermoanaerobaculia bacterium]
MNIAQSLGTLNRYEEALPSLDRALAIRAARPDQPIPLAEARFYKGQILWEMGRRTESLALIRQAREVLVRQGEPARALLTELDAWRAETGQAGGT